MRRGAALLGLALLAGGCRHDPGRQDTAGGEGADVVLETPRVDLGRTLPGGRLSGGIRVRAGTGGAVLTQVSPSCGCTISETRVPLALKPGESRDLPVALDLSRLADLGAPQDGSPRLLERTVAIATARGTQLTAIVAAEVSDRILVRPAQVRFASLVPGRSDSVPLEVIAGPAAPDVHLTSVETVPGVTWAQETGGGRGPVRGVLTWSPAEPGDLDGFVTLRFTDPQVPELRLHVSGHAERAVSVLPDAVTDLAASTSKPVVATVTLNRRDGLPLEILGASCTAHRVEVTVHAGEGPVRTLRVVVPVLPLPGEIVGTIVVRTNVEGVPPIQIPVHVRASG